MSEDDVQIEVNPIMNMIDYAMNADFNKANAEFNALINQRMVDALEQEKIAVASGVFGEPEEELEYDEDEDVEAAADDAVDEFESDESETDEE